MAGLGLEGVRVLVTGGGVGIGRGVATAFAAEGARVAVTYRTHAPDAGMIADCPGLLAIHNEATDEGAVTAATDQVAEAFGGIDVLVNNVGGLIARSPIAEMSLDLWREVMDVNVTSMFLFSRAALGHMTSGGSIVNMASVAGHNGCGEGATAYAASKAAMFAFTRGLAKELAPRGITVNAVAPGFIDDTPFHEKFTPADVRAAQVKGIPLGRVGLPADVAGPTLWLASPLSRWVTGTVVDINGGAYIA